MSDESRAAAKPNRGQFRKGRSGNPGGRPTVSRARKTFAFDVLVEKTLTVAHHGCTRDITVEEGSGRSQKRWGPSLENCSNGPGGGTDRRTQSGAKVGLDNSCHSATKSGIER